MIATQIGKTVGRTILALSLLSSLQGCPLLVAGAAGGGALVASDRRTLGAQTEDREIQVKAVAQLKRELPNEAHISVTAFNRRVLLTGEAPNASAKLKAETIVRAIGNVQEVVNELAVQGASSFASRSNDSYLTAKIKASHVNAPDISATFIKVVTERGIVYLMGLVTNSEGKRAAELAGRVPGVLQVVKVFQYISDAEAKKLSLGAPPQPGHAPTSEVNKTLPTSSQQK
ncbi:transport-associated protein [Mycoavidus cysteinexigens]|uniref:Transport-associated protein n=1 Tax=Mycoavidus cysteinexigens TaxID=1553431 RepID=A0A2Z6EYC8_9BURK|nr:BON domain-containing protein [Mycoavidus cysteinexigens]BBE10440.1 transport-associated protein [Mycoavidus cysteinexigens]GAM53184.1 21 kDa hemolysin precursor [bacterium endosymbiont of Mortierella elongata FMR23-6]GLR01802.1 lipoprotein [Mycoavidus cysteinexigens]